MVSHFSQSAAGLGEKRRRWSFQILTLHAIRKALGLVSMTKLVVTTPRGAGELCRPWLSLYHRPLQRAQRPSQVMTPTMVDHLPGVQSGPRTCLTCIQ